MAYITGTGSLSTEELECENTGLAFRSKDVTGTGALEAGEVSQNKGTGLAYIDGEILGHLTDLTFEQLTILGVGKADNLVGIPRDCCGPIKAKFYTCSTKLEARFQL